MGALVGVFDRVLSKRMRTPRALKRMFGQLDTFSGSVGSEVSFSDFILVTWLRTFEPGAYRLLEKHRGELLGEGDGTFRFARSKRTNQEVRKEWKHRLRDAHVSPADVDDVLYVISRLFPRMRSMYTGDSELFEDKQRARPEPEPGAVAHPDYFDRYFALGVPLDDIADSTVAKAFGDLSLGVDDGDELAQVNSKFTSNPELILRKLEHLSKRHEFERGPLAVWLAEKYRAVGSHSAAAYRIENLFARLLVAMPEGTAMKCAVDTSRTDQGLFLVARARQRLAGERYGVQTEIESGHQRAAALAPALSTRLRSMFEVAAESVDGPLDLPLEHSELRHYWLDIDPGGLRGFLDDAMALRGWQRLDVLAWFVGTSRARDGEPFLSRFSDLNLPRELFEIDAIRDELQESILNARGLAEFHDVPATPENRRGYVLAVLRASEDSEAPR